MCSKTAVNDFKIFQFVAIIFYILPHYWQILSTYHSYQSVWFSRNTYPGDPTPYFFFLYTLTFAISTSYVMHKIIFHKKLYLQFLISLSALLKKSNAKNPTTKDTKVCHANYPRI